MAWLKEFFFWKYCFETFMRTCLSLSVSIRRVINWLWPNIEFWSLHDHQMFPNRKDKNISLPLGSNLCFGKQSMIHSLNKQHEREPITLAVEPANLLCFCMLCLGFRNFLRVLAAIFMRVNHKNMVFSLAPACVFLPVHFIFWAQLYLFVYLFKFTLQVKKKNKTSPM